MNPNCGSMMPTEMKYNVWSDEDGDYFGEGHIPPEEFRAACVEVDKEYGYQPEDEEGCGEMDPAQITHEWWYQPDPDNDELMKRCAADHPGAFPFTAWRR